MNPNLQLLIANPANPATSQFVQCDGGNDSTQALQLQILLQLIEMNRYLREAQLGRPVTDESALIRSDALTDTSMFQIG